MWEWVLEHLLFTLVFNLKFNLLKQLKAYTSQSNIHTHSSQPSSRLNYHSVAQCEVGSTFPLLSNFDRQFIRTAIECRMVKDRMKIAKNATKLNRLHSRRLVLMRLTVATMWVNVLCYKQAEGAKRFNYFTRVFKTNILWSFCLLAFFPSDRRESVCAAIESLAFLTSFSVTVACVLFTRCIFNLFSMRFFVLFSRVLVHRGRQKLNQTKMAMRERNKEKKLFA